jgi:hypothetical protein
MATPLELPMFEGRPLENPLLYGSVTRDNAGRCYVGGVTQTSPGQPVLVQIRRETA